MLGCTWAVASKNRASSSSAQAVSILVMIGTVGRESIPAKCDRPYCEAESGEVVATVGQLVDLQMPTAQSDSAGSSAYRPSAAVRPARCQRLVE